MKKHYVLLKPGFRSRNGLVKQGDVEAVLSEYRYGDTVLEITYSDNGIVVFQRKVKSKPQYELVEEGKDDL